jgi:4'-phosphopantetheinyl transferase
MGIDSSNQAFRKLAIETSGGASLYLHMADLDLLEKSQGEAFRDATITQEHSRADRFVKPEHGKRFLASRFFLRQTLAQYTGEAPVDIRIAFTEREKPYLADHALPFNLSHSGTFAVVGIARTGDVGIDIETRSTIKTAHQVSGRIMTEPEHATWRTIEESHQMDVFLKYWTLKEAILKAHGDGLLQDPRGVQLDLGSDTPRIEKLSGVFGPMEQWQIGLISPSDSFPRIAWALRI